MAQHTHNPQAIRDEIARVQHELETLNDEAIREQRRLEMAESINAREHKVTPGKSTGPEVIASTQRGRLQEIEERDAELRGRLSELQHQLDTIEQKQQKSARELSVGAAEPPQHDPIDATSELGIGVVAWVTQEGGPSTRLYTRPGEEAGGMIDRIPSGTQMTILDGPAEVDNQTWWRVRTTEGREGWVPATGLRGRPA